MRTDNDSRLPPRTVVEFRLQSRIGELEKRHNDIKLQIYRWSQDEPKQGKKTSLTDRMTIHEWIAGVTIYATADGIVIHDSALGINATGAGTGIDTFLIRTGSVSRTI